MTTLAAAYGADSLGEPATLTNGYSAALLGAAGIAAAAAVLAAITVTNRDGAPAATETENTPATR
jgi:hypothetical protein